MKIYESQDRERIEDMIKAFELCRAADKTQPIYICYRLNAIGCKISNRTYFDCKSLIRRALAPYGSLDAWQAKSEYRIDVHNRPERYHQRKLWLNKIIKDLRSYLKNG